ncbi:MAG TPA: ribokinase [Tepidisphaeraceae bacterium]|nr:ribokinase [Tepidisphaeraceae bacterium]
MAAKKRIVVVGSINMDLVVRTARMPAPGETVAGDRFVTMPGGKGANQAVAAARLAAPGTEVHLVGRVGQDDFGSRLLSGLAQFHVNTKRVTVTEGVSTGVAMILVDRKGENSIVVAAGANAHLCPADIDAAEGVIASASAVIMQLEVPLETIAHTIAICRRHGVHTILDPAPVPEKGLPRALCQVDILIPNQSEAEKLIGVDRAPRGRGRRSGDSKQIASRLAQLGCKAVLLKLGSKGAKYVGRDGTIRTIRGHKVNVIDTTACGDAFTGAWAVAHVEEMELPEALRFANTAGALACQGFGAQPSLPDRAAVELLLPTGPR